MNVGFDGGPCHHCCRLGDAHCRCRLSLRSLRSLRGGSARPQHSSHRQKYRKKTTKPQKGREIRHRFSRASRATGWHSPTKTIENGGKRDDNANALPSSILRESSCSHLAFGLNFQTQRRLRRPRQSVTEPQMEQWLAVFYLITGQIVYRIEPPIIPSVIVIQGNPENRPRHVSERGSAGPACRGGAGKDLDVHAPRLPARTYVPAPRERGPRQSRH